MKRRRSIVGAIALIAGVSAPLTACTSTTPAATSTPGTTQRPSTSLAYHCPELYPEAVHSVVTSATRLAPQNPSEALLCTYAKLQTKVVSYHLLKPAALKLARLFNSSPRKEVLGPGKSYSCPSDDGHSALVLFKQESIYSTQVFFSGCRRMQNGGGYNVYISDDVRTYIMHLEAAGHGG